MSAEIESLKIKVEEQEGIINSLKQQQKKAEEDRPRSFSVESVLSNKTNHKDLFKHYAGITYIRFCALLSFLIPWCRKFHSKL